MDIFCVYCVLDWFGVFWGMLYFDRMRIIFLNIYFLKKYICFSKLFIFVSMNFG